MPMFTVPSPSNPNNKLLTKHRLNPLAVLNSFHTNFGAKALTASRRKKAWRKRYYVGLTEKVKGKANEEYNDLLAKLARLDTLPYSRHKLDPCIS